MNIFLIDFTFFVIFIVLICVICYCFHSWKRDRRWPFHAKKVLSNPEQVLYFRLVRALPECVVLAQVGLSRVIGVDKGVAFYKWFNKISMMSLDFVVCSKSFDVLVVIELDDATHSRPNRIEADLRKEKVLVFAGIKLIRWKAQQIPSVEEILEVFDFNEEMGK
jgi:hypothetical protein